MCYNVLDSPESFHCKFSSLKGVHVHVPVHVQLVVDGLGSLG